MFWSQDWSWSLPLIVLTIVVHVVVLGFATTKSVAILGYPARRGEFMLRFLCCHRRDSLTCVAAARH